MTRLLENSWEFGGPLAGLPVAWTWTILASLAVLGLAAAAWSYARTVRPITRGKRATLLALRATFFLLLLLCLANPVRVEKATLQPEQKTRRLAVVIDRSDSMTTPDNRGRTRLDDAQRRWRALEPAARNAFAAVDYHSIAADLRDASSLDAAVGRTEATGATRLFQSIADLVAAPEKDRPDAIVVLTDGLDTTNTPSGSLATRALINHVELAFVAGTNRLRPAPYVRLRELRAPAVALRNTEFVLEGTVEAFSNDAREVPYSLWRGDTLLTSGRFALGAGRSVLPWQTPVKTGESGQLELTLRLGADTQSPVAARTSTSVVASQKIRVLFYQGALDWGFRYLTDALKTDPSFELTSLMNPALRVTLARTGGAANAPKTLPDTAAALVGYDFIILAHLYPSQLSDAQQQALIGFVRDGGSVLFTSPDPAAVPQFKGRAIAELLPVILGGATSADTARELADQQRALSRINASEDGDTAGEVPLFPFMLTPAGLASPVFKQAGDTKGAPLLPRFAESVNIERAKPGAEILATHPNARVAGNNTPRILLAAQTFGRGRTALLATDGLWRWKLSVPSSSHVVETFWQQLLLWLGGGRARGPHFVDTPAQVPLGERLPLRIAGVTGTIAPTVVAVSPAGETRALTVSATNDPEAPWSATWTASATGAWELRAGNDPAATTRVFPYVVEQPRGELARTPPAVETLRTLAEATRGAMITDTLPASWRPVERTAPTLLSERRVLRWNIWPVIAGAFACYACELLLRRRWRLL